MARRAASAGDEVGQRWRGVARRAERPGGASARGGAAQGQAEAARDEQQHGGGGNAMNKRGNLRNA